jgi:hypothetical protein
MLRQDQYVKAQLAVEAWRHGHTYGGATAMLLIAHCIANRVRAGWGDWLYVIDRIPLFSAKNINEQPKGQPQLMDPNFIKLLQEIEAIYDGSRPDPTLGGLYFADLGDITREWFKAEVLARPEEHPRTSSSTTLQFWG